MTSTTIEVTTTTIPATTTTADPRVVAADKYIELVTSLNCSVEIVTLVENEAIGADGLLFESEWNAMRAELQSAYASHAQDRLTFMNGLIAFDGWPEDVQPNVDALIAETALDASYSQSVATASTYDAFVAVTPPPDGSAAAIVRAKLGLESNIGSTTQFCVELAD